MLSYTHVKKAEEKAEEAADVLEAHRHVDMTHPSGLQQEIQEVSEVFQELHNKVNNTSVAGDATQTADPVSDVMNAHTPGEMSSKQFDILMIEVCF